MFSPKFGPWTIEDFSNSSGLSLDYYQTITGGYLTLLPLTGSVKSFSSRWYNPTSWDISNNLNSISNIEQSFTRVLGPSFQSQVIDPQTSGSAQLIVQGGSWNITTYYPRLIGSAFSGQSAVGLLNNSTFYDPTWYNFFTGGGSALTLEVDVASTYEVHTGIQYGFTTGQEILTTLPRLSGFLNHGIYLDNGTNFEFIEVNPDGVRLYNHPEICIPSNFGEISRLRVGIDGNNIFLSTEDGRGVAGIGKFDTPTNSSVPDAKIFLGAPYLTGSQVKYRFYSLGVSGFVGNSYWDNIKILYGENLLNENTSTGFFTTVTQSGFTDIYDPGVSVVQWSHALIGHTSHRGGTTTVTAQYSGNNGWQNYSSITLSGQSSPTNLSLTSIPVKVNSATGLHNKISNPVRFMIQQQSNGLSQPPAIDSIELYNTAEESFIDMLPNWKQSNQNRTVQVTVDSGKFFTERNVVDPLCNLFIDIPDSIGSKSSGYTFEEISVNNRTVTVSGDSYIGYGGPHKNFLRNFVVTSGSARQNSEAETYFGQTYVNNFFPNPLIENGFNDITGDRAYVPNRSFGHIAEELQIVPGYTGRATVFFQPLQTFDPITQANSLAINEYLGNSRYPGSQIVQNISCMGSSFDGTHDATCGVEAIIPSGIASGQLLLSADLKVVYGTGIQIYATGSVVGSYLWTLDGTNLRDYRTVSFPLQGNGGNIYLGFIVQSGTSSADTVSFNIDNILLSPISSSYSYIRNVSGQIHQSGLYRETLSGKASHAPYKSDTVFSMDAKIIAYPTGTNNYLVRKYDSSNKGFGLYLDNAGRLGVTVDTISNSWTTGMVSSSLIQEPNINTSTLINYNIPLGVWNNIGLCHQVDTYKNLSFANYSGAGEPVNFASSNRLYVTVNGYPIYSVDLMKHWANSHTGVNAAPYVSYIPDNSGNFVIGSGILMEYDTVNLLHPVYADTEINQSIKNAKVTMPYFVPDVYFKPVSESGVSNSLIVSGNNFYGNDLYIGSIYNFNNPGYPYWDHGSWKNHLLFYGSLSKSSSNPYSSELGSTYIESGSYATAHYSSSTERLLNHTGNIGINNNLGISSGEFKVAGWVRPHSSGNYFFHICKDINNLSGHSISLGYTDDMRLKLSRFTGANLTTWSSTGLYSHVLSGWNWFELHIQPGYYSGVGATGIVSLEMRSLSGVEISKSMTGTNYGFQYMGRTGSASESCIVFGNGGAVDVCDWIIAPVFSGDRSWIDDPTGDKLGSYQTLLEDNTISSIAVTWSGFDKLLLDIPANSAGDYFYSVGTHNFYYGSSRMNQGIRLYDDIPFRSVPSYLLSYNRSEFDSIVGSNASPIRIGNQLPPGAINIARVSNVEFDSESSISVIDLSYLNTSNIAVYKDGTYTIGRNGGSVGSYTATGSYNGINSGVYSGRSQIVMSGQVQSENIDITSVVIADPRLSEPTEAFYCYLVGRGRYGVRLNNYYPHLTGHPGQYQTGNNLVYNYTSNLEEVYNSIKLADSIGTEIPFESYPFSVAISSYSPENLFTYSNSGQSFDVNSIGIYTGVTGLPDGVYSTILLLNKKTLTPNDSVWVTYQSFDYLTSKIDVAHKEIVNAIPIMRKKFDGKVALPGQYEISTDSDTYLHSLTIHGINSGYTSNL